MLYISFVNISRYDKICIKCKKNLFIFLQNLNTWFKLSFPVGFASSSEAKHVAEITSKLANFVIETDTEVSAGPTDTGIAKKCITVKP